MQSKPTKETPNRRSFLKATAALGLALNSREAVRPVIAEDHEATKIESLSLPTFETVWREEPVPIGLRKQQRQLL